MADKNEGIYGLWKRTVPASARLYTQTLFGDKTKPFTEKDFTPNELKNLEETIQASKSRLESGIKNQKYLAERAKRFSEMYSADNEKKLLDMTKKDPEWQQLSALYNKSKKDGNFATEKDFIQYAELSQKIADRYKDFGLGNNIMDAVQSQNNIPQIFNDLRNKNVSNLPKDSPQYLADKAARNEQYINQGTGNVQYSDYTTALINRELQPGAITDKALGRFQYKTDPITGQRQILDNYDFSNTSRDKSVESYANMDPFKKATNVIKKGVTSEHGPFLGLASEVGNAYIGKDGRPVDIKYDPNTLTKKKGGKVNSSIDKPIKGGKKDI